MKIGGQIIWNAVPICETFKISWQMGELHTRNVLENHIKARSFRLARWLKSILSLRKTCRDSTNSVRKSNQQYSSVMYYTQPESGKEIFWSQTLRIGKKDASEIHAPRLNAKEVLTSKNS